MFLNTVTAKSIEEHVSVFGCAQHSFVKSAGEKFGNPAFQFLVPLSDTFATTKPAEPKAAE